MPSLELLMKHGLFPNPTARAKRGSKRHLICDGRGVPLAVRLTGANRNDSQEP